MSIEPKQTEDPPKQYEREHIWVFFRKFRVVSVCFGLLRNSSGCFGCFDIGSNTETNRNLLSKHRNKPKSFVETPKQTEILCFWFHETNRNRSCFGLFRFERNLFFEDTLVQLIVLHERVRRGDCLENSASSCC